jgi:hypothetical protein
MAAAGSDALMPVVVFDPTPAPASGAPVSRVPVPPRFPAGPHTPRPSPGAPAGVVVQRQVVIGSGAAAPPASSRTPPPHRPRRPAPSIPYVVKEGSHTNPSSQVARPAAVSPARPMAPPPSTAANAPRTSAVPPNADLISDKSLDEVILAYLSQGDTKE